MVNDLNAKVSNSLSDAVTGPEKEKLLRDIKERSDFIRVLENEVSFL